MKSVRAFPVRGQVQAVPSGALAGRESGRKRYEHTEVQR